MFTIKKPDLTRVRQLLFDYNVQTSVEARGDDPTFFDDIAGWSFDILFPGTSILSGYVALSTGNDKTAEEVLRLYHIWHYWWVYEGDFQ